MSRKRALPVLILVILLTIGGLYFLGFRFKDMDWNFIRQISTIDLIIVLIISFISIGLYTLEVFLLINAAGFSVSFGKTYLVLTASMSANYITPLKAGIPLRIYLYKEYFRIALGSGSAIVAVETILGLFVPAGLSVIGIKLLFPEISIAIPLVLMGLILIILGLFLFPGFFGLNTLLDILFSGTIRQRMERFLENLSLGITKYSFISMLQIIGILMMNLVVTSFRLFMIIKILGGHVPFGEVFFTRVISVTAGSVSMIPMGLGVRDASVTFLLTSLGATKDIALTSAVIERLFSPGFPLLLGLLSANILGIASLKKVSELEQRE